MVTTTITTITKQKTVTTVATITIITVTTTTATLAITTIKITTSSSTTTTGKSIFTTTGEGKLFIEKSEAEEFLKTVIITIIIIITKIATQ